MRKDVIVQAPAGVIGPPVKFLSSEIPLSPEEIITMMSDRIKALEDEVKKHKIASSTIARAAVVMFDRLVEVDPLVEGEVVLPREQFDRKDRNITLSETGLGDIVVRVRSRIVNPGWEGA